MFLAKSHQNGGFSIAMIVRRKLFETFQGANMWQPHGEPNWNFHGGLFVCLFVWLWRRHHLGPVRSNLLHVGKVVIITILLVEVGPFLRFIIHCSSVSAGPKFSRMNVLRDFNGGLTVLRILQHPSNYYSSIGKPMDTSGFLARFHGHTPLSTPLSWSSE